ncbi:outer membrane protein [Dokdonia sp. Hel_I_53]|uniref:outer membrane protein n=1 Tax=Dokdonia sp. Hel_I_53 TaxID=1566287 RepID=UPI001199B90E|nr:outer membrane beta-barrel protein [Dokdonia sp. Hel_I_53]TVZ52545.1 opacity protein-like surface antigen [Dokdonia sp. Hel_I_53]
MTKFKKIKALCLFLFTISLSAQESGSGENTTRKGRLLLGASTNGGLNFSKTSYEFEGETFSERENRSFVLNGSVGYFIIDNLVGGVQLGYSISKNESKTGGIESSGSYINLGPFATYYFDLGNNRIRPYVDIAVLFGSIKTETSNPYIEPSYNDPTIIQDNEFKQQSFEWNVGAGAAFFLNDTISINVEAVYSNRSIKDPDDESDSKYKFSNIGLNGGLSIFL